MMMIIKKSNLNYHLYHRHKTKSDIKPHFAFKSFFLSSLAVAGYNRIRADVYILHKKITDRKRERLLLSNYGEMQAGMDLKA